MNYNGPVTINAYGDTNGIPAYIQQALNSTGIGLNHVPAGVKDASDKKILVDMLFWAVDNPAPANYLLISGERDFSNAIHQLRMRYNILLAQPFQASPALASAATNVWQWTNLAGGGSPRELAFGTNTLRQESIPITTPITQPISVNQPAYSNANVNTNTNASSPQRLSNPAAYSNANVNTNTNASGPQRLSNPAAYSNANASGPQRLSNHGRNVDTKTKTIYIAKNSNQLNITGGSSMPARIEETISSYSPHKRDVAPKLFAPHHFFVKSDSSENHSSKFIENKPAQLTQSQPLVPDNFSTNGDNLLAGRGDLCGSMNKGDVRPEFSFLPSSLGVYKSVCSNSDLGLQLSEHIQVLITVILLALNTLKLEKLVPTKENISKCIRFGNPKYHHIDMILKLGQVDFELYVGRTERIWNCENPLGGNPNQYEAALILRNACLKDLTLGGVFQILNMIISLKRWIKTSPLSDWQPITITLPETNNDKDTRTDTIAADIAGSFLHRGQPYVKGMELLSCFYPPNYADGSRNLSFQLHGYYYPQFFSLKISFSLEILFPSESLLLLSHYYFGAPRKNVTFVTW
ncbi:hypothetical protein K7X08_018813 [Anisodus acutangulus]|uniref:NYN domain-containing protein n=1 Tax=Anisodus acutangulus TaxID=402998 RepID=A0A9Q1LZ75_9SOLA|nr:hypothetical protein K7X08_018813 [Anisodus acutangulus]